MEKEGPHSLSQLKQFTRVVADTGDFGLIKQYEPEDATTNPSLIFKALQKEEYAAILDEVVADVRGRGLDDAAALSAVLDEVIVRFGLEILKLVPGRVSTEVDARLSFDTAATVAKARELIAMYEGAGISRDRVLIKIASTWEGIQAAKELQQDGINCNMTLLFSLCQAVMCAEVGAKLISPFVGRILDWYKASTGQDYSSDQDPGVVSVKEIYNYYKKFGYETEVMGASFRNTGEILELAGCDLLTISPGLLGDLQAASVEVPRKLDPELAAAQDLQKVTYTESSFRFALNEDAMATEKLSEGIRVFSADISKLEEIVRQKLAG